MALVEISVIPLGTPTPSISEYIVESLKVLKESGLKYALNSMGTVIEGELDNIMMIVRQMHKASFKKGVKRVVTTIKIDEWQDKYVSIKDKVRSVEKKLEH
jgi:uncharacterized protein (TIGR00106 family)